MGIQERKEREKEQRKEVILNAAQRVFFEKGLQLATVDEIAEYAELSKGTIYLYYNSKEDLYLAVLTRGMQLLQNQFAEKIKSQSSTLKALLDLVHIYFEFFQTHRGYYRMFQFLQTPQFHKQVSEDLHEASVRVSHATWDLVIALIQRGIDEGLLAPDVSAGEAAAILWFSSSALLTRIDTESEAWKTRMNIDLDRVLRLSTALYFDSLLTPTAKRQNAELLKAFHPRFTTTL